MFPSNQARPPGATTSATATALPNGHAALLPPQPPYQALPTPPAPALPTLLAGTAPSPQLPAGATGLAAGSLPALPGPNQAEPAARTALPDQAGPPAEAGLPDQATGAEQEGKELEQGGAAEVELTPLQRTAQEVQALLDAIPAEGIDGVVGSEERQSLLRGLLQNAASPKVCWPSARVSLSLPSSFGGACFLLRGNFVSRSL